MREDVYVGTSPQHEANDQEATKVELSDKWEAAQRLYGGKVKTFARNSFRQIPYSDLEDVEQELLVVLWECVVNYDPNRGACFNTYFQQSAKNKVISLIRHHQTKSRDGAVVSMSAEAVSDAVDEAISFTSAEELAMMRITLREYVSEHGQEALYDQQLGGRRGRQRVSATA